MLFVQSENPFEIQIFIKTENKNPPDADDLG